MSRKNRQAKGLTGTLYQKLGQLLALSANPQSEPGKPYLLESDGMLSLQFDALCLQSEMNMRPGSIGLQLYQGHDEFPVVRTIS